MAEYFIIRCWEGFDLNPKRCSSCLYLFMLVYLAQSPMCRRKPYRLGVLGRITIVSPRSLVARFAPFSLLILFQEKKAREAHQEFMKSASDVLQGMMQAMVGAGNGPRSRGLHPVEHAQLSALLASWYSHGVLPPSSLQDLEHRLEALKISPSAASAGEDSAGSAKRHVAWIAIPPPPNDGSPREAAQVGLSPTDPSAASASSSPRADDDQKASMGASLEELLAQNSKNADEWWGSSFEGRGPFREGPEGHWSLHFRRVQDNAQLRRQKGRGLLGMNGNDGGTAQDDTWRAGVAVSGAHPTTLGFQAEEGKVSTGLRDPEDNGVKLYDEDGSLSTPSTVPSEAFPSPERPSPTPAAVAPVAEPAPRPAPAPAPKSHVGGEKKSEPSSAPRAEESPSTAKSAKVEEGESGQPREDKSAKSKSGQQSQQKQQQRRSHSREKRELSKEEQEAKDRQRREEARRAGKEKGKMRGLEKERQRKDRELQRQRIIAEAREKKEAAARAEREAKEKAQAAAAVEAEATRRRKESEERARRLKAAEEEKRRGTRGKSRERDRERKRARGEQSRDPDSRGGRHGERAPNGGRHSGRDGFSEKERERGSRGSEMDIVAGRDRVDSRPHLDASGSSRERQRVKSHEDRAGSDDRGRDGRRAHGSHRSSGDPDADGGWLKHDSRDGDSDNGDRKRRRTKLDHETGDWRDEGDSRDHRSSKKKSKKERKEKKEKRKDHRHSERCRGGSEELRGRKRSRDFEVVDDESGLRSSRPRSDLRDYADHPPRRPVDPHRQRSMEAEMGRSGSERRDSSRTGSGSGMGLNLSRQESGGSSKGGDVGDREDRRAGRVNGSEQRSRRNDGGDAPGGRDDVGDTKERQATREVTRESAGAPTVEGGILPGMDVYGTGASPPSGLEFVGHGNRLGNGRGDHHSKSGSLSVDKYGISASKGRETYPEGQKKGDGSRPRLAGMTMYGTGLEEEGRGGSRKEKGGRDRDHAVVDIGGKGASDRRDDVGRQSGLSTVSGFRTVTACKRIKVRYSPFLVWKFVLRRNGVCLPQKIIWALPMYDRVKVHALSFLRSSRNQKILHYIPG